MHGGVAILALGLGGCSVLGSLANKAGFSGKIVRGAFKTVKSFKPGIIPMSMDALLDDFAVKVDPHWQACQSNGTAPRSYFVQHKGSIAEALLEITDERAAQSKHKVLVRAYKTLRGKAVDHISQAMPRLADLMVKHAS